MSGHIVRQAVAGLLSFIRNHAVPSLVVFLVIAAGVSAAVIVNHRAATPVVLKAADDQALNYPTTQALIYMGRLLSRWSGGRIKVVVYYDGQLGDEVTTIRKTIDGSIDIDRVNLDPLTQVEPALRVFAMPYIFRSAEQMHHVVDGPIGRGLLDRLGSHGLVGLGYYDSGARSFYVSRGPIHSVKGLKGLKIRVQKAPIMEDIVRSLGAIPVPMPYQDVYTALETGVIDGAENNIPSWVSTGHYEVARYYLRDDHVRVPELLIMSKKTWRRLSASDQALVVRAAKMSVTYQRKLWQKAVKGALAKARAAGCEITSPSDLPTFKAMTSKVYDDFDGQLAGYVKRIRETP